MTLETQQLQIAFVSTDGLTVDGHFGSCEQFDIYTVDAQSYQKIGVREAKSGRGIEKNAIRAEIISDCHLMFCASIGGPAAARVIRTGIHPMKCKPLNNVYPTIEEQLQQLQQRIHSESLPPWLAKLTGQTETLSSRFDALA
ncbi:dinitrogenase iron-molybdenum cofactor biosynthesis protein [Psychromonas marina]|uniref:Dinitrogenase iron-molybdenum cofactor biosynthesis protein n=1 Tax=Psychromonas marina TaxID=88364 RepID=A0ABQ6E5P0_9GAMM|nr:NifB/NifX family molybdenum-iron cluster-binding protein [Psychromonas marina]GLS92510.1 dinitrogenase iron-molybdenum cofactor biosynthesis protein [Psychromonas marina]